MDSYYDYLKRGGTKSKDDPSWQSEYALMLTLINTSQSVNFQSNLGFGNSAGQFPVFNNTGTSNELNTTLDNNTVAKVAGEAAAAAVQSTLLSSIPLYAQGIINYANNNVDWSKIPDVSKNGSAVGTNLPVTKDNEEDDIPLFTQKEIDEESKRIDLQNSTPSPKLAKNSPSDSSNDDIEDADDGANIRKSPKLGEKFENSTFGKNFGSWSSGLSIANNLIGLRPEMNGPNAGLSQGIQQGWDSASDALAQAGPYGQMASLAMKAASLGNNIAGKIGGGTDGMTTTDSILGSPLGFITGVGLVNGFGGAKADTITKDEEAFSTVGASYGGTGDAVDEALKKSGKKYGFFSSGARKEANKLIFEAKRQQSIMADISSEAQDRSAIQSSMSAINQNRRLLQLQGGYNLSAIRAARHGVKVKTILDKYYEKLKLEEEAKQPLKPSFEEWFNSLKPDYRDPAYDYRRAWELFDTDLLLRHAADPDNNHLGSIYNTANELGEIPFLKLGTVEENPEIKPEFEWYYSDAGAEWRDRYDIEYRGDRYYYVPKKVTSVIEELVPPSILEELALPSSITELEVPDIIELNPDDEDLEYTPENPEKIIKFVNKHKKVNFVQRLKDIFRETISNWEDNSQVATHKLAWAEDRGKIKVFPMVLEIDGELHDFTDPLYKHGKWDALESAEKNHDVIIFDNADDADWFTKNYKEFYPTFDKYREGGKFNVIPEGALHARLHHMENDEDITKKGIPVVVETSDGKLSQQAEIERNEVIFRLSVTKLLEELANDGSDASAIEAGKLLVKELLYNTIDNTGLINEIM